MFVVSGKAGTAGTRTSVVLTKDQKSKLFMLSQALNADMGDIIREAIELFYEYTKEYAIKTNNTKVLRLLELAEDSDVWETGVKLSEVKKYAQKKIEEGDIPANSE
jgi:oligoribonuclease NrnB/cAMP/cGMP phosphodiesterase (DHH superfamily)